jgi:hypothetical protein
MWTDFIIAVDARLALGLLLSAGIGLSLGLIGGGGSIITVPLLVYGLGVEPHAAMGMSLGVVGATSLAGAALHHRQGTVRLRTGFLFAAAGMLGAYFGTRLTYMLSDAALLLTFAALMIVVAIRMLAGAPPQESGVHRPAPLVAILTAGAGVGVLTGFLGVGGGFLIVPALVFFGGLGMKEAVGTSLLVITLNCVAGLAGHLQRGAFDLWLAALVTLFAVAGVAVGARLAHRASPQRLGQWFAWFVLAVAALLVAKNLPQVM